MNSMGNLERQRAEVFASVLNRVETDWHAFRFSPGQRRRWVRDGIPADKAHWAAILRDLHKAMPSVPVYPSTIAMRRAVKGHKTEPVSIIELLRDATPAARIAGSIAAYRHVKDPMPRAVRAVIAPRTIRVQTSVMPALDHPASVSDLMDKVARAIPPTIPRRPM